LDIPNRSRRKRLSQKTIEWERANPPEQVDPKQFDYAAEDAALEQLRVREKIALAGW